MSRTRVLLPVDGNPFPEPGSLADPRTRPGTIFTPVMAAAFRPTALPLMGRFADDAGPLARDPPPAPRRPKGNRRQRRADH